MIVFQVITYASNLFFDFYVTCFLLCLKIDPQEGLEIAKSIKFLFTKFMFVLFLISIVYMSISSKIMKTIDTKRFKKAVDDYNTSVAHPVPPSTPQAKGPIEERLQKLQAMLENNLITQEEFDKKKQQILGL